MALTIEANSIVVEMGDVKFVFSEPRSNDDPELMKSNFIGYMLSKLLRVDGEIKEGNREITADDIKSRDVPFRLMQDLVSGFAIKIADYMGVSNKGSEEKNDSPSA